VQDVPVVFDHELLVQTMNDPDCVGCAMHGGYRGLGDVREVEVVAEPEITDAEAVVGVGVEMEPVAELLVEAGNGVVVPGGSTAAHMEEIVSSALSIRSAAHDSSKHEFAKGLNVLH
jgi:hypothetical protein